MEKFEKHIKEKLETRKIDPSSEAWRKISEELSTTQKPKRKNTYRFAIAAGFIGFLLALGIFLFNSESNENTIPVPIVEIDTTPKEPFEKNRVLEFEPEEMEVAGISEQTSTEPKPNILNEPSTAYTLVEIHEVEEFEKMPLQDSTLAISEDIISKKVSEVMNQVTLLEDKTDAEITDAEVDSLLRTAQREILTDKLLNPKGKVDAMALLTEVEDELDESFRDQLFEALKQGYLKVRNSVAARNN
ncbi:MAG: hypothetical protein AAGA43_00530 [Bacteroidota bacterium]